MQAKELYANVITIFEKGRDLPLLLLRVILAYTFFGPVVSKLSDMEATANYFDHLGIPFPLLNTYLAAGTETLGVVLLTLGFMTRFISIGLLVVMSVAIATVHGVNGFHFIAPDSGWENPMINGEAVKGTLVLLQNGYELVMYYSAMLLVLISQGAGRVSLDQLVFKRA
jgi:putative oxidoreductase